MAALAIDLYERELPDDEGGRQIDTIWLNKVMAKRSIPFSERADRALDKSTCPVNPALTNVRCSPGRLTALA